MDHVHNLNVSHVNWDHLFAKTSRLFCGIERAIIYHHNNLTLLDWSIMKIVQVTVFIPHKNHIHECTLRKRVNSFCQILFQHQKTFWALGHYVRLYNNILLRNYGLLVVTYGLVTILYFIYSLDVRGKPLGQAQHWSESTSLGKRTSFRTSSPNGLLVEGLKLKVSRILFSNRV